MSYANGIKLVIESSLVPSLTFLRQTHVSIYKIIFREARIKESKGKIKYKFEEQCRRPKVSKDFATFSSGIMYIRQ